MRIQLASDLHLEFLARDFPGETLIRPARDADVLVLAWDISAGASAIEMFKNWPVSVLYVCGNHEFYSRRWEEVREAVHGAAEGTSVKVLERDVIDFGGVRILGCTLWTDYLLEGKDAQSGAMAYALRALNDHRLISTREGRAFAPIDALRDHELSRAWLAEELGRSYSGQTVVITHHAPHPNSIHAQYLGSELNPGFASDLTPLVEQADLWLHGHVHNCFDYRVGRCRVVANPRGYALNARSVSAVSQLRFENPEFNYGCLIDVAPDPHNDDTNGKPEAMPRKRKPRGRKATPRAVVSAQFEAAGTVTPKTIDCSLAAPGARENFMRVIFLDFDGVVHAAGDGVETVVHFQWLHVLVQLLEPWADVHLAVHSTWRYLHTSEELRALLGPLGPRFIGAAPRGPRAEAILWFLHMNPTITRYLVLDDAPQEFPADFPGDLVFCDSRSGVSAPEVRARIRAWLEGATQTPGE